MGGWVLESQAWLKRLTGDRRRRMMARPREIPITECHVQKQITNNIWDPLKFAPGRLKRLTRYHRRHLMSHRKEIPITESHVSNKYTNKFRGLLKLAPRTEAGFGPHVPAKTADSLPPAPHDGSS